MTISESKIIDFSFNWNYKLNCTVFTTIRLHNDSKYVEGELYGIRLKGRLQNSPAKLLRKKTMYLKDFNEWHMGIDMGYTLEEGLTVLNEMYKNKVPNVYQQKFDWLLLRFDRTVNNLSKQLDMFKG